MNWYRLAAEQGDAEAKANFDRLYNKAKDAQQDAPVNSIATLEESKKATQNYASGVAAHKKGDYAKAMEEYKKAAAHEGEVSVSAHYMIGNMYDQGNGFKQDFKEAAKWYQIAAEKGNELAQFEAA